MDHILLKLECSRDEDPQRAAPNKFWGQEVNQGLIRKQQGRGWRWYARLGASVVKAGSWESRERAQGPWHGEQGMLIGKNGLNLAQQPASLAEGPGQPGRGTSPSQLEMRGRLLSFFFFYPLENNARKEMIGENYVVGSLIWYLKDKEVHVLPSMWQLLSSIYWPFCLSSGFSYCSTSSWSHALRLTLQDGAGCLSVFSCTVTSLHPCLPCHSLSCSWFTRRWPVPWTRESVCVSACLAECLIHGGHSGIT